MSTTTSNMGLVLPTPGVDPGPTYAQENNTAFTTIDSHNHSNGKGVPITPSGLSITSDLSFLLNNATNLRSVRFSAQASPLTGSAPDLDCLYVSGVDLYYNDGNGNQVQITSGGSVLGSTGTITGLPSGTAGAAYSATPKSFIFSSATSVPANLDLASAILRNLSTPTNAITLAVPGSLASAFTITLPSAAPGSTQLMQMDASGNISVSNTVTGTLTIGSGGSQLTHSTTRLVLNDGVFLSTSSNALIVSTGGTVFVQGVGIAPNQQPAVVTGNNGGAGPLYQSGQISAAGSISNAFGIAGVTVPGTGVYGVTWTYPYLNPPMVLVTLANNFAGFVTTSSITTTGCTVETFTRAPAAAFADFNIVIIGPRADA